MVRDGFFRGVASKPSWGWYGIGMVAYVVLMTYLLGWPVYYEIAGKLLLIRMGVFKWKIPIEDIVGAQPSRCIAKAPALSMDRVRIDYQRGGSRCSMLVSPEGKRRFFEDLVEASPSLRIAGDRVLKVT